jgi:MscS family membrane protein
VPNAKLSDNSVTNFSGMTFRRIFWTVGVEYRTTVDQLREIRDGIETYVLESDDFVPPEQASTFVRIDKFNDSSIDIMLYCFTRTTRWGEWLAIKEKLAYHIKDTVEAAGTGFAFPSRSLYVEALPAEQRDDQPEAFVPPDRNRTESQDDKEGAAPPGPRRGRKEEAEVNAEPGPQKGNDGE